MLGRYELSDADFVAVSIARGNNQGIKGQVFQRATRSTGTLPGVSSCLVNLKIETPPGHRSESASVYAVQMQYLG
jgi:hypothetical protein